MPVLLDAAGSSHADLRQCAVYGVGVGAALAPELFKPHAPAALAAVTSIISAPVSLRCGCVQAVAGCFCTVADSHSIISAPVSFPVAQCAKRVWARRDRYMCKLLVALGCLTGAVWRQLCGLLTDDVSCFVCAVAAWLYIHVLAAAFRLGVVC
jgi:hypothetical protein